MTQRQGNLTEHMKPTITQGCPNIQIGGMPERSSIEHLATLKTWIKIKEEKNGIFQVFYMAKFFNKESLIDTLTAS